MAEKKETDALGFSVADVVVSQQHDLDVPVKRAFTHLPVRRPSKQTFFRVPQDWPLDQPVYVLEDEQSEETYILSAAVAVHAVDPKLRRPVLCVSRDATYFLWLASSPMLADGRKNDWGVTALQAANEAKKEWTCLRASRSAGGYEIFHPEKEFPEPEWVDELVDFEHALGLAFKDRYIGAPDHEVLRRMRGEF